MTNLKPLAAWAAASILLLTSCAPDDSNDNEPPPDNPCGMVRIQSGGRGFQMGSAAGFADEAPVHTVNFTRDFWMDSTEVTQGDYDSLMRASYPAYTTPGWFIQYGHGDRFPAYHVYWADAVLYCNARSRRDGLDSVYTYTRIVGTPGNLSELEGVVIDYSRNGYRLPTEAEWEYACRGGRTTDFYWNVNYDPYPATAADSAEVHAHAVWYANSWVFGADVDEFGTHPVAQKAPNAYRLYDMAGNVYEWCADWYGEYPSGAITDPIGPADGEWRILRGGSWGSNAIHLRSPNRTFSAPDYVYYFIGFRVVRPVI